MAHSKKSPVASGERFQSLVKQLSSRKGLVKPHPLATEAGKKKYGAKRIGGKRA